MTTPPSVYQIAFQTSSITEATLKGILDTLESNSFILLTVNKIG